MFNNSEQKVLLVLAIILLAGSVMRHISAKPSIPLLGYHSGNKIAHYHNQTLLNLNSATLDEFESLDGIGAALAKRIIEYRVTHKSFNNIDDLLKVKGMTRARLRKIYFKVTL